ncbi:hypothetical protein UPYG_G00200040 [Umbra pygmaea]|uniref:Uncharacterized protein n=1 Tax=Umbra pygmaea TaxID=75934 RepID=A0ABD0WI21_UMBPY
MCEEPLTSLLKPVNVCDVTVTRVCQAIIIHSHPWRENYIFNSTTGAGQYATYNNLNILFTTVFIQSREDKLIKTFRYLKLDYHLQLLKNA